MPKTSMGEQIALAASAVNGQIHIIRGNCVMVGTQLAELSPVAS